MESSRINQQIELIAQNFKLQMSFTFFVEDSTYPSNTILEVTVQSDGFAGTSSMDIDIRELVIFSENLSKIYEALSGEARMEEPYGMHMYLQFTGDKRGHIAIKGFLHRGNRIGIEQSIEFENCIDQTELRGFCFALRDACKDLPFI